GFLAGLFGIGGGTVLVPAFFQVFGAVGIDDSVRMHLAVGTSITIVVATSLSSFLAHHKRGTVDESLLKSWIAPVPLGTLIAVLVVAYVSSGTLRVLFAVICILIAVKLLIGRDHWRLGEDLPQNPIRAGVGVVIGLVSTLMGIGGGVLNNTFMTAYGRPIHQAVSTSAGVGVLIAVPGCLGYIWAGWGQAALPAWSTGYVNWFAVALVVPLTLWVTPYGVKVAHASPRRRLEVALGVYLMIVAARFFWTFI
ncbi:MAG: sulfite exporter TauE/SafE family protein, partial [Rhizobiaceae bacterium]